MLGARRVNFRETLTLSGAIFNGKPRRVFLNHPLKPINWLQPPRAKLFGALGLEPRVTPSPRVHVTITLCPDRVFRGDLKRWSRGVIYSCPATWCTWHKPKCADQRMVGIFYWVCLGDSLARETTEDWDIFSPWGLGCICLLIYCICRRAGSPFDILRRF